MFLKLIKNDFLRKKIITAAVFIFITLAVILGASATNIVANLIQSMSELQAKALPADLAQMHIGPYDQAEIDSFSQRHREHIAMQETMLLLNVDGSKVQIDETRTLTGTVQDISFVVQNSFFDFIVDLNNKKLDMRLGEVAVPIYFMQEYDMKVGDVITLRGTDGYRKDFVISQYARDYEMNSSLTSSKRFVIHQAEFDKLLANQVGELEYLIEFKLHEKSNVQIVQTAYIEAGLPANGPTVGARLFLLFNAMSDAAVAMVIILVSLLLVIVALLCIRLTFVATIDEDLREIGVMKAIGIPQKDILKVYMNKYSIMSVTAGLVGYLLSFVVVNLFNHNMRLYLSSDLSGSLKYALSLIAPVGIHLMIMIGCVRVLGKIDSISAVQALRSDILDQNEHHRDRFPLLKNRLLSTNIYLGLRDVGKRFNLYRLLFIVYAVCTFIAVLPLSMFNTMNSPEFSTYMGIGRSDLRIDLRKSDTISEEFTRLQAELRYDPYIEKSAAYITSLYQVKDDEGSWDYITIETGDFTIFPMNYLQGRAPQGEGEMAISHANASADGLGRGIGDAVIVKVAGLEKTLTITGIYQDITNGGKTAKADTSLGFQDNAVLWYIVNLDVAPGVDVRAKMDQYQNMYKSAQVNDITEYTRQTLGNIIDQMGAIVIGGIAIAVLMVVLITALFLKMLLSKDIAQIAIMRSLGLTTGDIKCQYMAGVTLVLLVGISFGLLASNYGGEFIVSLALSSMGAARIQFVDVAWQTWLLCPLMLFTAVGITITSCCHVTSKHDISVVLRG